MRIVFGVYNIGIKEYTPIELGITDEAAKPYTFAVKQRIFHLFWIPVFPLYKIYAMVDRAGTAYHAPTSVEQVIKSAGKHRTPWYSFALLILGIVILSGIGITESYNSYKDKIAMQANKEAFVKYSSQLTKNIQKGDVFVFYNPYDWDYNADGFVSQKYVMLVDSIAGGNYFMHTASLDGYENNVPQTNEQLIQYLAASDSLLGTLTMTKAQLNAFQGNALNNGKYYISGGSALNGIKYVLHHKLSLNRPNLFMERNSYSSNQVSFTMRYIGPIARIIKFEAIEGINGSATYNKILANENNVQFQTQLTLNETSVDDHLKFKLTLEDENGKQYKYLVQKEGYYIHCILLS